MTSGQLTAAEPRNVLSGPQEFPNLTSALLLLCLLQNSKTQARSRPKHPLLEAL